MHQFSFSAKGFLFPLSQTLTLDQYSTLSFGIEDILEKKSRYCVSMLFSAL